MSKKIEKILERFAKKHELSENSCLEIYFQCDSVTIEGSQEVFPEILELFMKGKDYRYDE